MSDPLIFKTRPYAHQLASYERYKREPYFALWFEQRCGKTKVALDVAAHQYLTGMIDSLLVIAPASVSPQWVYDAVPEHLSEPTRYLTLLWRSNRMGTVEAKRRLEELLAYRNGLRVLVTNIDALITKSFRDYLTKFFRGHRVMTVVDESVDISNPKSKRTQKAIEIGRRSVTRVTLDGTPVTSGPLGLYSQCDFLEHGALGYTSYWAFRARYAEMETKDVGERDRRCPACHGAGYLNDGAVTCQRCRGGGYVGKNEIQVVKSYQHLEELQKKLFSFSTRVLRADCADLPVKVRQKVYFDLPDNQRRVYDDLREQYRAELRDGTVVTAAMVLTRYVRLQQTSSGFLPGAAKLVDCQDCHGANPDCLTCEGIGFTEDDSYPLVSDLTEAGGRLDAFSNVAWNDTTKEVRLPGQGIVWCRFRHDVDAVVRWCGERGLTVSRYDGANKSTREEELAAFRRGDRTVFVGTPSAGGRGLELSCANWAIYYSHHWSLRQRLQSEDRAQSLRKSDSVLYVDLIASGTVDEKIVTALREGKRLADLVTGDRPEEWL